MIDKFKKAVGPCPICKIHPTWFNDVPLRAFCCGPDTSPHEEMSRLVPGTAQPYGKVSRSVWKRSLSSK